MSNQPRSPRSPTAPGQTIGNRSNAAGGRMTIGMIVNYSAQHPLQASGRVPPTASRAANQSPITSPTTNDSVKILRDNISRLVAINTRYSQALSSSKSKVFAADWIEMITAIENINIGFKLRPSSVHELMREFKLEWNSEVAQVLVINLGCWSILAQSDPAHKAGQGHIRKLIEYLENQYR